MLYLEYFLIVSAMVLRPTNPLTPVLPITNCDEPWHLFHFWHYCLWPKLASSTSARGNDLSSDTEIRVICSVEPEICTKMPRNLSEKLGANFPVSMMLSLKFLKGKQAEYKVNHCCKKIRKGESKWLWAAELGNLVLRGIAHTSITLFTIGF